MILAYYSRTGNVADFLGWYFPEYEQRNIEVWDADEPFILFTPSYNLEDIVEEVDEWLKEGNAMFMEGVVGSGNRNFGRAYCISAVLVAEDYYVPILGMFELKGNPMIAADIKEEIRRLYE